MARGSKPVPDWADKNVIVKLAYKSVRMIRDEGLSQMLRASKYVIKRTFLLRKLRAGFYLSTKERALQSAAIFDKMPLLSVVVPLYNTPENYLRAMITSVMAQSYQNWQLCLCDGSDEAHRHVGAVAKEYAAHDQRVLYSPLAENLGISGNTNEAIALSSGDYIALLDHDDLLAESALYEVVQAINETDADFLYSDEAIFTVKPRDSMSMHFKPDYSPDFLRACNYICHLSVIRRQTLQKAGLYNPAFDGSQDYDFTLRVTECAERIHHIPKPLYYWRSHSGSVADNISAKSYAYEAAKKAVESHLRRIGLPADVVYSRAVPMMRVGYRIQNNPLISIIIPTCDHSKVLKRCLDSIFTKSSYTNYEIIICENNSKQQETFDYYQTLEKLPNIRLVTWVGSFNYSAINNFARSYAKGAHLVFLNNDTEIITRQWMEELVMFTQRTDVAACGAKLLYANNTVQHGGIAVGIGGSAANLCPLFPRDDEGYMCRLAVASNMSACTAACLCVRADCFDEVNGFDENLAISFNDVDLCLKLREKGRYIVFNPECELYHHESISRGYDNKGAKKERMEREKEILRTHWQQYYSWPGDPFYNPNFGENAVSYDA